MTQLCPGYLQVVSIIFQRILCLGLGSLLVFCEGPLMAPCPMALSSVIFLSRVGQTH